MKEQNPDIPFIMKAKTPRIYICIGTETKLDALILDPRGVLVNMHGTYRLIPKAVVINAARALRDERKLSPHMTMNLWFTTTYTEDISAELGKAIEAMAEEIKALERESHA